MPSLRRATKEQFADGTTIDGNRIDRALQDLVNRWNAIQPMDLRRRWLPSYFIFGYQGQSQLYAGGTQPQQPWLNVENLATGVTGGVPEEGIQNVQRIRGTKVLPDPGGHVSWTIAMHFIEPCILRNFHVTFHTPYAAAPTEFTNDWAWAAPLPAGRSVNDPPNDVVIEMAVDNPFIKELRSKSDSEVLRGSFELDAQFHAPAGMANHTHVMDGLPALTGIKPDGVSIVAEGLNVPIPRESRVRFSVCLPLWDFTLVGSPWGLTGPPVAQIYETQFYSGGFTILEATK